MVAMMLPTAIPMILTFAKLNHTQSKTNKIMPETTAFVVGYLVVWLVFSLLFTLLQEALLAVSLVSGMMAKANNVFGGIILVSVGIYQFTSLKDACLRACQTPLGFLMTRWKERASGAFGMGIEHGIYCVGFCWALMLLMFVGGVMDLVWMAILAAFMLGEKMIPPGNRLPQVFGAGVILWGGLVLVTQM